MNVLSPSHPHFTLIAHNSQDVPCQSSSSSSVLYNSAQLGGIAPCTRRSAVQEPRTHPSRTPRQETHRQAPSVQRRLHPTNTGALTTGRRTQSMRKDSTGSQSLCEAMSSQPCRYLSHTVAYTRRQDINTNGYLQFTRQPNIVRTEGRRYFVAHEAAAIGTALFEHASWQPAFADFLLYYHASSRYFDQSSSLLHHSSRMSDRHHQSLGPVFVDLRDPMFSGTPLHVAIS